MLYQDARKEKYMSVLFCTCAVKTEYENCLNVFKSEVYLALIKSGSVYSISVVF